MTWADAACDPPVRRIPAPAGRVTFVASGLGAPAYGALMGRRRTTRRGSAAATAAAALIAVLVACTPGAPFPTPAAPSDGPTGPPTSTPPTGEPTSPEPTGGPPAAASPLTLYLVRLGDDGASGEPIGCGDSLVPVETEPIATDDPLRAAIVRLLETPEGTVVDSGLYTAVPGGTLDYVDGWVDPDDTVIVELTGMPLLRDECDGPRVEAQLERTAMTATGAWAAVVLLDGVRIEQALGLG